VRLSDLLRGTRSPVTGSRPRRRTPRADGPRTIVPVEGDAPSGAPADRAVSPFDLQVDAARERLRRAIPPVGDDAE
jgi:hypothetical protein